MSRAVAISILACKRHQHLGRALASKLRYADEVAEIIVVDFGTFQRHANDRQLMQGAGSAR